MLEFAPALSAFAGAKVMLFVETANIFAYFLFEY